MQNPVKRGAPNTETSGAEQKEDRLVLWIRLAAVIGITVVIVAGFVLLGYLAAVGQSNSTAAVNIGNAIVGAVGVVGGLVTGRALR